jgi:hypothetical protein
MSLETPVETRPRVAPAGPKPPIPFYWWPLWMLLLAGCLFVFYVVFTPVWIGIRLTAWLSERRHG